MFELFAMGSFPFMIPLTVMLGATIVLIFKSVILQSKMPDTGQDLVIKNNKLIKSLGLFALVFGILGQLLGLYEAFDTMSQIKSFSPSLLAAGFKVSMVTTIYGFGIFLLARGATFFMNYRVRS